MATSSLQFQQETSTIIKNLETQVSQLASIVTRIEAQAFGKFPSQTVINPRENASAVTLRSVKQLEKAQQRAKLAMDEIKQQNDFVIKKDEATSFIETTLAPKRTCNIVISSNVLYVPFPNKFATSKKEMYEKEILETFHKV